MVYSRVGWCYFEGFGALSFPSCFSMATFTWLDQQHCSITRNRKDIPGDRVKKTKKGGRSIFSPGTVL